MTRVLVTGAAGMIGYHLVRQLAACSAYEIRACDSFTNYYDVKLKEARSLDLKNRSGVNVDRVDLCEHAKFGDYFDQFEPEIVVHLAAQPGVRQGLVQPEKYINSNLVGFANLLDICRTRPPEHLLYASSSSVYGANTILPWSEDQVTDHPISLYAATKKANELMAHSYSHLTSLPMTGLRFFTVYGEWGRPDMAPYKFAHAIRRNEKIIVFNQGQMSRDFTYVGDTVDAVIKLIPVIPSVGGDFGCSPVAPHRVTNIGCSNPVTIAVFISAIERCVGHKARIVYQNRAPGDVLDTFASTARLEGLIGYRPTTTLDAGLKKLCDWLDIYEP